MYNLALSHRMSVCALTFARSLHIVSVIGPEKRHYTAIIRNEASTLARQGLATRWRHVSIGRGDTIILSSSFSQINIKTADEHIALPRSLSIYAITTIDNGTCCSALLQFSSWFPHACVTTSTSIFHIYQRR